MVLEEEENVRLSPLKPVGGGDSLQAVVSDVEVEQIAEGVCVLRLGIRREAGCAGERERRGRRLRFY